MIDFPSLTDIKDKLRLAKSLAFINRADECKPFVMWLQDSMSRMERLQRRELDETVMRQRQGGLQAIESILREIQSGDERFREFKEREHEDLAAAAVPRL